jgi:hypothetical protein
MKHSIIDIVNDGFIVKKRQALQQAWQEGEYFSIYPDHVELTSTYEIAYPTRVRGDQRSE